VPDLGTIRRRRPYDYLIFKDGTNYCAQAGTPDETVISNPNFRQLVTPLTDAIPTNGSLSLFFKNGTYLIDNFDASFGWIIGELTNGQTKHVHMCGETRDGVALQNAYTPAGMYWVIHVNTNFLIENMTFDGNSLGATHTANLLSIENEPVYGELRGCRFKLHTGAGLVMSNGPKGIWVHHNQFDTPAGGQDQMAFESTEFAHVHHNYFDRTAGTTDGSSVTCGEGTHIRIHNNIIRRLPAATGFAISLEAYANYSDCHIFGNDVNGGNIVVGPGPWDADYTFRQISIYDNDINDGGIEVQGRPSGGFANSMKGIVVENNRIRNAYTFGIYLEKIADRLVVRNNTITDTNLSNTPASNFGHLTFIECTNFLCNNNMMYMLDTSNSNRNFYGMELFACTNGKIFFNHVYNLTVNPAWVDFLNSTGMKIKYNDAPVSEKTGTATFSGNATTTTFNIAHGLYAIPTSVVISSGSTDTLGDFYVTYDATNITVNFNIAPPSGSNNLVFRWTAEVGV
jgi:hypothetical protein